MGRNLELIMSTDSALISIVVPIYNAENYIDKCLQSLRRQTHKNIEIICIDDCSTDKSADIIQEQINKDSRIKLYSTPQNSGPATARNIGLKNAHGEYIMFCDNDDAYTEQMCEVMLKTMQTHDVDIVTCKSNIKNELYNTNLANYINGNPTGFLVLDNNQKAAINVLLWNKIYKKQLIDQYNIKFPDGISAEDDAFIMKYLSVIKTYYGLKSSLYNHLFRKSSFTNTLARFNLGKRKFDKIKIIEDYYNFLKDNNLFIDNEYHFRFRIIAELKYLFTYNRKSDKKKIIELYNDFVKRAELLDYQIYCYSNLYKRFNRKRNFFYLISFIRKCYWF